MNRKSVMAHAILALGGLTLAYLVWTDEGPTAQVDEVELVDCDPEDVTAAELHTEGKDVTLVIARDGDDVLARVTVVRARENSEDEVQEFVASNDSLGEWLEQIAPLRARRTLGDLDDAQLEEIGLEEDPGSFSMTCGGTTHTFQIGGRAYGSGDRYARLESGGPVHLLGNDRLQAIESAEFQLMERRLHIFEWTEVTELRLEAWEQSKTLLQRNRIDADNAEWVDAENPERRNEVFGNWLSRYARVRVQRYLAPDEEPGSDLEEPAAAESVMRLVMQGEDGELGHMEMRRVDATPLAYYVRTETTRDWVRVPPSAAQGFEDDARSVLGMDPLDRPEPPPRVVPDAGVSASDAGTGEGSAADASVGEAAEAPADAPTDAGVPE